MDNNIDKRLDAAVERLNALQDKINRLKDELPNSQDKYDILEKEKEDSYQQGYNDGANAAATDKILMDSAIERLFDDSKNKIDEIYSEMEDLILENKSLQEDLNELQKKYDDLEDEFETYKIIKNVSI